MQKHVFFLVLWVDLCCACFHYYCCLCNCFELEAQYNCASTRVNLFWGFPIKVSKGAKIRNRCNQVPHLTQDTKGKVINLQLDTTNESQEVSPLPAGDHKAHINKRVHSKHKPEQKHKRSTKKYRLGTVSKIFYWRA